MTDAYVGLIVLAILCANIVWPSVFYSRFMATGWRKNAARIAYLIVGVLAVWPMLLWLSRGLRGNGK